MITHMGSRSFKCELCHTRFAQTNTLAYLASYGVDLFGWAGRASMNKNQEVWLKMFFLSLLLRQRWHSARRCIEDICVLENSNVYRGGEWMLCEVTKAMKDDRDKFKDVEVVVKSKQNNEHEFQLGPLPLHEPDDQVSVIDLQLLPQYEPVSKGDFVQLEPLCMNLMTV